MEISLEILLALFAVAAAAGFIDAMAGGGGLLTLPALLAAGLPPLEALATNKLQGSFSSFSASWYFVRNGIVDLRKMKLAIVCTIAGSALGATLAQYIAPEVLTNLIPLLLIAISIYFFLLPSSMPNHSQESNSEAMLSFFIGGGVGFYCGFFGPGTGSIFTFLFVSFGGLCLVNATARTKVLNFTANFIALVVFILAGLPIWKIGLTMAVGGFIGAQFGAKVVVKRGQRWIKPLVILMSILIALKLLWDAYL
ncbi:UPF0721 transmembrane protein [Vibrio inusitatus NBRC 102082]|uniref:Probable membrane transporter protein n=1 Tax=Vibrio inusitatus NBRC 102082 TaxID=1219070 RepID=A0A4Y3HX92_9VIBR|nr:TSUP family transporter [Vibrio inusitatus]GEA51638.1 UPF0721 transmembrane protein [Vibrio inusitatus NBRC 102082]